MSLGIFLLFALSNQFRKTKGLSIKSTQKTLPSVVKTKSSFTKSKEFTLSEYKIVFENFISHFKKDYTAKDEKAWRFKNFVKRINTYLVSGVPLQQQISFAGVAKGKPVPLPPKKVRGNCKDVYYLRANADLSMPELLKRYTAKIEIKPKALAKSNEALKKRFPEAASLIDEILKTDGSLYKRLIAEEAKRPKKKDNKKDFYKNRDLLRKMLPKAKKRGPRLPALVQDCSAKPQPTELKGRMLVSEKSSDYVAFGIFAFRDEINYQPWMTPVQAMGYTCNACYSFVSVDLFSITHNVNFEPEKIFSVQDPIDCADNYDCHGCNDGDIGGVYQYINDHGIALDGDYPYVGEERQCLSDVYREQFDIEYTAFWPTNAETMRALEAGPVIIPFYVTNDFGGINDLLDKKIFWGSDCVYQEHYVTHALLVLGYRIAHEENPTTYNASYFLAKNSWGDDWGDNGYIRLVYTPSAMNSLIPCTIPGKFGYQLRFA